MEQYLFPYRDLAWNNFYLWKSKERFMIHFRTWCWKCILPHFQHLMKLQFCFKRYETETNQICSEFLPQYKLRYCAFTVCNICCIEYISKYISNNKVIVPQKINYVPHFILCTGARHYALYRFTLIANKICPAVQKICQLYSTVS